MTVNKIDLLIKTFILLFKGYISVIGFICFLIFLLFGINGGNRLLFFILQIELQYRVQKNFHSHMASVWKF